MAGDPSKASLWADADVYFAPLATALPTDALTAFPAAWKLVGLLDGEAGFTHTREEEEKDFYAWGGVLVRTSRRNFKQQVTWTALEDNENTRSLIWPGSSATALKIPVPVPLLLALEKREGAKVHRLITTRQAVTKIDGDITDSEADLTKFPFRSTVFPTATKQLWTVQEGTAA